MLFCFNLLASLNTATEYSTSAFFPFHLSLFIVHRNLLIRTSTANTFVRGNSGTMKELEDNLVFVVDDNDMQSMMMDYVLSKENPYKVVRFKSGEECLANLNQNPDVIVLDYTLPGINGMETFNGIKKHNPAIPVFIISATENKQLEQQFLEAGVYSYIVKKSDAFHSLGDTITSLLSNSVSIPEHNRNHRQRMKLIFSVGFILLVAVAGLLYFVMGKHLH